MSLVDSAQSVPFGKFTVEQLVERANYMRGLNLTALCSAGSGHSGGTLGIMDICAALYLQIAQKLLSSCTPAFDAIPSDM